MAIQIITTTLPNGTVGVAYSQTAVQTGGQTPIVWSVSTGTLPTSVTLNTATGNLHGTPSAAGTFNFTLQAEDDNSVTDTQAYTVRMFAVLNTSPDPLGGDSAVYIEGGSQLQFSSTGGSGNFVWSVTGGNIINPSTGLLTAINGGAYVVTLTDTTSGQVATINIVITSQSQFCVQGVSATEDAGVANDSCCEYNVECGERLTLRIPSFHVVENGQEQPVIYSNLVQTTTGAASALQSTSVTAGATGNEISFARDAFYEIVTSFDMAQTANGEFGIGWSAADVDSSISSIDHAVVWFTDGSRIVEIRHAGSVEADSQFDIAQGDAVSFGQIGGAFVLKINSVTVFTSVIVPSFCGNAILDIGIENANKTIGGYVQNLNWSVATAGSASEVGSIDANGVYTSPSNPIAGVVKVLGALNNANFYVNVRNIQPTPRYTKPQAFLAGRKPSVWVTNLRATDNDIIRIASDGSPDAIQNPGMVDLGTLEASATFAEEITRQDFDNDEGTYFQAVASEKASLTGSFLEVRDFDKMALMMQHATLYPQIKGVSELGVGGKLCGECDLRVALIVESGNCGSGWDVIYMPRVQYAGNLSLEIGRKTAAKQALNFKLLLDPSRPRGKQLYSIYQMANCTSAEDTGTCE